MSYRIISPYAPSDCIERISQYLNTVKARIQQTAPRSFNVKVKTGFLSTLTFNVNVTEIPIGSLVNLTIPNLNHERRVDQTFFGKDIAEADHEDRLEKANSMVDELRANIDGLTERDIGSIRLRTNARFLAECPKCSSTARKGFKCAYCGCLMVKYE